MVNTQTGQIGRSVTKRVGMGPSFVPGHAAILLQLVEVEIVWSKILVQQKKLLHARIERVKVFRLVFLCFFSLSLSLD